MKEFVHLLECLAVLFVQREMSQPEVTEKKPAVYVRKISP